MHAIKESRLTYLQQVILLPAQTQRILTIAKQETQATRLIIAWRLIIMSLIITNRYCYHIHAFIISNWTLTGLCMTALCPCMRLSLSPYAHNGLCIVFPDSLWHINSYMPSNLHWTLHSALGWQRSFSSHVN